MVNGYLITAIGDLLLNSGLFPAKSSASSASKQVIIVTLCHGLLLFSSQAARTRRLTVYVVRNSIIGFAVVIDYCIAQ